MIRIITKNEPPSEGLDSLDDIFGDAKATGKDQGYVRTSHIL